MTVEEAKQIILQDKKEREEECAAAIEQFLKEKNCVLEIGMLSTSRGDAPQLRVVARD